MRRLLLTTSLWLFGLLMVISAPVDEQSAKKLAQDFLNNHFFNGTRGAELSVIRAHTGIADGDDAAFYVFNSDGGFVMVSGDDTTPPILGFAEGSTYDAKTAPETLQFLLGQWQKVHASQQNATRAESVPTHTNVDVLIKTQWDQTAPYNLQCPTDDETKEHYPTGCVATAMAQVMYYHRWPDSYDWSKMKLTYNRDDTGASADAVAKLMKECGDALFMQYATDGSSAYYIMPSEALRYDFGYAESTDYAMRENYTAKQWDALIYEEISHKRPVITGGNSASPDSGESGHEFIIDGYQVKNGQGYYHVNWGWGGYSDNYFLLALLNPGGQGTGGNAGSSGYNYGVVAVIGTQPAQKALTKTNRLYITTMFIDGDIKTYNRESTNVDFPTFKVKYSAFNIVPPEETRTYDVALALYKSGERLKILGTNENLKFDFSSGYSIWENVNIGKDLSNDTYEIRAICRESGQSDWTGLLVGYDKYLELTVNGKNLVVTYHGPYQYNETDFMVNSVSVGDIRQQGKVMTISVNVTDKNVYNNEPIFLWGIEPGTSDYKLLTGCGTNLDAGATGDVVLEYTPSESGTYQFAISGSPVDCTLPLKTFSVDVAAMSMADVVLSVDITADNSTRQSNGTYRVSGSTLSGEVRLTNSGTEDYYDYIVIYLMKESSDNTFSSVDLQTPMAYVKVGKAESVSFEFQGLDADTYYALMIGAIQRGDVIRISLEDGYLPAKHVFYMSGGSGIDAVTKSTPDGDVYNLKGVKMGKISDMESLPQGIYIINKKKVFKY